jgi:hypothetical protein
MNESAAQQTTSLSPNTLAFMALSNEYCHALETAQESSPSEFAETMTRLYMTAAALTPSMALLEEDAYIDNVLDEDYYESVRLGVENLLGADDVYLEVFEEDMKYSDTPISASIAEGLTDIFQVLYNFLDTVRDATDETIDRAVEAVRDDFASYWSQKVCNVMRPLNHLRYGA